MFHSVMFMSVCRQLERSARNDFRGSSHFFARAMSPSAEPKRASSICHAHAHSLEHVAH